MNRSDEYQTLLQQLKAETPAALDHCIEKARTRVHRRRRRNTSLASLGGIAAAFVMAVNLSLPFAFACGRVPLLRDLAAAAAISPSLKAAVRNDFVQYIGQSQTIDDITLTVDYAIADQKQLHLFFHFDGDFTLLEGRADFRAIDNEEFSEPHTFDGEEHCENRKIYHASLEFPYFADHIPAQFRFLYQITAIDISPQLDDSALRPVSQFSFDLSISLDSGLIAQCDKYILNQWVELDGQRILLKEMSIYPTHCQLDVEEDPNNSAYLKGLTFYAENEWGKKTEPISNGITGIGDHDNRNLHGFRNESAFFWNSKKLTLHITAASWLDKEYEEVAVDIANNKLLSPTAPGIRFGGAERRGDGIAVTFFGEYPNGEPGIFQMFSLSPCKTLTGEPLYTPDNDPVGFYGWSYTESEVINGTPMVPPEGFFAETSYVPFCPTDQILISCFITRADVPLEKEVIIVIK